MFNFQCVECCDLHDTRKKAENCHLASVIELDEMGVTIHPYMIESPIGYYVDEYDEWKFERLLSSPFGRD